MCHFHPVAVVAAHYLHDGHMYLRDINTCRGKFMIETDQVGSIAHPGKWNPGTPGQNAVHRPPATLQREST